MRLKHKMFLPLICFASLPLMGMIFFSSEVSAVIDTKTIKTDVSGDASGSGGNLTTTLKWLEGNPQLWGLRGEFQQKLLYRIINEVGGYPNLKNYYDSCFGGAINNSTQDIGPLSDAGIWTWYYYQINPNVPVLDPSKGLLFALENAAKLPCYSTSNPNGTRANTAQIKSETAKLRVWLNNNEPSLAKFLDSSFTFGDTITLNSQCAVTCNQTNTTIYTFRYEKETQGSWGLVSANPLRKCEKMRVKFLPNGEWVSKMSSGQCTGGKDFTFSFASPPVQFSNCTDQKSCLASATETELSDGTFGKGVHSIPSGFINTTEKSLINTTGGTYISCNQGICISYVSGKYKFKVTAPASTYYGECRGLGATITPAGKAIDSVSSEVDIDVVNQAPVVSVNFAKDAVASDEVVSVGCEAIDPDCPGDVTRKDKIAKIQWTCADSNGNTDKCFFKNADGTWSKTVTQTLASSEQDNPKKASIDFKATNVSTEDAAFAVTCEAWDNDAYNPLSGKNVDGVKVTKAGNQNQNGNENTNGVVNQNANYNQNTNGVIDLNSNTNGAGIIPTCHIVRGGPGELCNIPAETTYTASDNDNKVINISGATYDWNCGNGQATGNSFEQTCTYGNSGSFLPSLKISKDTYSKTCTAPTPTVVKNSNCQVKVRKVGVGSYSSSITAEKGDRIEARLDKECLSGGATTWFLNNSVTYGSNDLMEFTAYSSGLVKVDAEVEKGGNTTSCNEAQVDVKEKITPGT